MKKIYGKKQFNKFTFLNLKEMQVKITFKKF